MTPTGLARFVAPRGGPASATALPHGLDRVLAPRAASTPGESCEMCGVALFEEHSHVVNVESRALLCTCRPCYLLFTRKAAAGGKYASVPDRHLYDPDFALDDAQWDELQIPVRMAFFFFNTQLGRTVAFYPSPAGATESLLPLDTWSEVATANPVLSTLEPDVEAAIIHRPAGGDGPARSECYVVPIDACYELVGRVRRHWKGFAGGPEVWEAIDAFFADRRQRSGPVGQRGAP